MPVTKWGSEFQVNTSTSGLQQTWFGHAAAALPDGRFVVAYQSGDSGDGFDGCVRGHIFNADGTPSGNDFVINSSKLYDQYDVHVAALANGNLVFTWSSQDAGDGTGLCIRARVFSGNGQPLGNDFVVDTTGAGDQGIPDVVSLANGHVLFTWASEDLGDGSSGCVRAREFDAAGNAVANHDSIVESTTTGLQQNPVGLALAGGGYAIAWGDFGIDPSADIRMRFFTSPDAPVATDFVVNTTIKDTQRDPSLAQLTDGHIVVAWASDDPTDDGNGGSVRARLLDASGNGLGNDFLVNSTAQGVQTKPVVIALADGRFMVFFQSQDGGDGDGLCIRGRLFAADGTADGNDFVVNTTGISSQHDVSAAALADGRVLVSWTSDDAGDGSLNRVMSQIVDPRGAIIAGTTGNDNIFANNANETVDAGAGKDTIHPMAGNDIVKAGAGNDTIVMDGNLNAADKIDGGADTDILTLKGNYGAGVTFTATTVTNVETIVVADGFSYKLTTNDATVAAGKTLTIDGSALSSAHSLVLDGSGETDGRFLVVAGAGADTLTGGAGGDAFNFTTAHLTGADTVDGGTGAAIDVLRITSPGTIDSAALASVSHIEKIVFASGGSHKITLTDAIVASADDNHLLTVVGGSGNDTVSAIGVAAGHNVRFEGLGGADRFAAGAGADKVLYVGVSDSTGDSNGSRFDTLLHFNGSADRIDLPNTDLPTSLTSVASGALSSGSGTFDSDLATAVANKLGAHAAVDLHVTAGNLSGHEFLVVNPTGAAGYVSGADYVFDITGHTGTIAVGDFT